MNEDNIVFVDPEEIAQSIFSKSPAGKLTYQIVPNDNSEIDLYEAYRILITILFEGMDIYTDGLCLVTSDDIELEHILAMNPWFHDLGINIICESVSKANDDEYCDYYCKTVIKEDSYKFLFDKNNIEKNYHFMVNGKWVHEQPNVSNLCEIYSIFISNNMVYKIRFELYHNLV